MSPLQYYQRALRAGSLRTALKQGDNVTDAIYNAGFGSSSRAYEGAQLGMTPARFAAGGRGEQIGSPPHVLLLAGWWWGPPYAAFAGSPLELLHPRPRQSLREEFPLATRRRDPSLSRLVDAAIGQVVGRQSSTKELAQPQCLICAEQLFSSASWQALRAIPRGQTRSYSQLARELGDPKATRAVARACAMNRVALVVPCHRVVGASGSLTGYRWGIERKKMLIEAESQ